MQGIAGGSGDQIAVGSESVFRARVLVMRGIVGVGDILPRPLFLVALVRAVVLIELGGERLVQSRGNGGFDRGRDGRLGLVIIGRSFWRGVVGPTVVIVILLILMMMVMIGVRVI
jgi:hypothetical protein